MKKIILSIISFLLVLIFSSCTNDVLTENSENDDYVSVKFYVSNISITQEKTRANTIQDAFPMLDLVLYTINNDGTYTKYKECSQTKSSSSFGVVTFNNVKCGTYKLVAIGHDDSSHPDMDDPTSIAFTKYPNLYGYTADVTITKTSTNIEVPFVHKTAKIIFDFNGFIPDDVEKIKFTFEGSSNVYNAITGFANTTSSRVVTINVTKEHKDNKHITATSYAILTQDELTSENSYYNIIIAGLDANEQEMNKKTYNKIPLKIGYTTTLSGVFFDYTNLSMSFSVISDWGTYGTVEL